MKMKKIIAMMALATMLTSGVTAHAFVHDGSGIQVGEGFNADADQLQELQGEIEINGEFKKSVSNLPDPTEDGHYLRVTMPIKMDFSYDADLNAFISVNNAKITNESVHAENVKNGVAGGTITPKKIKVYLDGLDESNTGSADGNKLIKFVDQYDANANDKVQVPLELKITGKGNAVTSYSFATLENGVTTPIQVDENGALGLELGLKPGEEIHNKELLTKDITATKHALTLRFEYVK